MFTQKEILPSPTLMNQTQPNWSKTGIVLQFLIYSLIILFLKIYCKALCISGATLREPSDVHSTPFAKWLFSFCFLPALLDGFLGFVVILYFPFHMPLLPRFSFIRKIACYFGRQYLIYQYCQLYITTSQCLPTHLWWGISCDYFGGLCTLYLNLILQFYVEILISTSCSVLCSFYVHTWHNFGEGHSAGKRWSCL